MTKAIIFDYGGVIEFPVGNLTQDILTTFKINELVWEKSKVSVSKEPNNLFKNWIEIMMETARYLNFNAGQMEKLRKLIENHSDRQIINKDLIEFISVVRGQGIKTGILSNYQTNLKERLDKQTILNLFDSVVFSSAVGYKKPDKEIFNIIFSELNVKPDEVVFVDDSESSFKYAEELGFKTLLFNNNIDFFKKINKYIVN